MLFQERGACTDEYLRLWQACWAPGEVSFAGQFFAFQHACEPSSRCNNRIRPSGLVVPAVRALRRAATFAQIWQPTPTPLAELRQRQAYLRQACAQIGRQDVPPTRMSFRTNFSKITGSSVPSGAPGQQARARQQRWRKTSSATDRRPGWPFRLTSMASEPRAAPDLDGLLHARGHTLLQVIRLSSPYSRFVLLANMSSGRPGAAGS